MDEERFKYSEISDSEEEESFWERAFDDYPLPPPKPRPPKPETEPSAEERAETTKQSQEEGFVIIGHPTYSVKWDDLGLGLMRPMGYMPGRPVRIEVRKNQWTIIGPRTNSPLLIFLALGAGGLVYFLRDLLREVSHWGEIVGAILVLIPTIINLAVRIKPLVLRPFELEFVGYDPSTQLLVLSTVLEPEGVVALKVEFPSEEALMKLEEKKLIDNLSKAHTGFMLIQGATTPETPRFDLARIKDNILWALVWLIVFWLYLKFGRGR